MDTLITTMLRAFPPLKQWVIPSYQRNYVWTEEGQWAPLWEDLMALTERVRQANSGSEDAEPHFLGTVITKHSPGFKSGRLISYWWVVDGQQRLTTLQLLLAAARAAFIQRGLARHASMLSGVLANSSDFVGGPGDQYKIRHKSSKRWEKSDYAVFRTMIDSSRSAPSSGVTAGSPLGDCYNYFRGKVDAWLRSLSEDDRGDYAEAFNKAVLKKLVVADIQLSRGQNSHAIFEALNARGKPLTEWEKTKNYILSLAVSKDDPDGDRTYGEHLERYDADPYWKGRIDTFLLYFAWLEVPRARRLVSGREPPKAERPQTNRLYREFRYVGEHLYRSNRSEFERMLSELGRYADIYREIDEASEAANGGFSGYALKVMGRRHILRLSSLVPVFMILVDRLGRGPELDRVLRIVDSYLMRRIARKCKYQDFDAVAFGLVQALRDTDDEEDIASVVCLRLRAIRGGNWWPRDDEVIRHFIAGNMYHGIASARLKLLLGAIAERMHGERRPPLAMRFALEASVTVEHVAPQSWERHWQHDLKVGTSEQDRWRMSEIVHRIGNLTLVTQPMNNKLSNNPWSYKAGLLKEDNLVMTRRLLDDMKDEVWNEAEIDRRSIQLAGYVNTIWPHAEVLAKQLGIELPLSPQPQQPEPSRPKPTTTNINTLYALFYRPLVARLRRSGMETVRPRGWRGQWRSFQTGHPGAVWGTGIGKGKATVFLHLRGTDRQQNYRALFERREQIAGGMDRTVLWHEGSFEITLARDEAISLTAPDAELETARQWMADNLLALGDALRPHMNQLMRAGDAAPDSTEGAG